MNKILPGSTLGLIGGSPTARLLALTAKRLGFSIGLFDPRSDCAAAKVSDFHQKADFGDLEALEAFAKKCDIISYNFENADPDDIEKIKTLAPIPQGAELLAISQDRLVEKGFLEATNVVIAPYETIIQPMDLLSAAESLGYPCVLKTTRGSVSGQGITVLHSEADIPEASQLLREGPCVLEAYVPYTKELSTVISGNGRGNYSIFPVSENVFDKGIFQYSITPAQVSAAVAAEIERIATSIAESLELHGALGVEFFMTEAGLLYVNEITPRPQLTGNYSLDACNFDQYEAHLRGICGWELPAITLTEAAVTMNIGPRELSATYRLLQEKALGHCYYYGNQKIAKFNAGHLTIVTANPESALAELQNEHIWQILEKGEQK